MKTIELINKIMELGFSKHYVICDLKEEIIEYFKEPFADEQHELIDNAFCAYINKIGLENLELDEELADTLYTAFSIEMEVDGTKKNERFEKDFEREMY